MKFPSAFFCAAILCSATAAAPVVTPAKNHMTDERWAPGAACLNDGRTAIIAGGYSYSYGGCVATADLFDEQSARFIPIQSQLAVPRDFPGTALLPNGDVLFAGGYNIVLGTLNSAEIYSPATKAFRLCPHRMHYARELFTATLLTNGKVLLAGGFSIPLRTTVASAELFDPETDTFTDVSEMSQDRFGHSAIRLLDGRVLITGGKHWRVGKPDKPLSSAEIYDPATNAFHTTVGSMETARDRPTLSLLADGTVLVAGGQDGPTGPHSLELFNPKSETFTTLADKLSISRMAHSAVQLPGGDILLVGGWSPDKSSTTDTTEMVDPVKGSCTLGPTIGFAAHDIGTVQFADGSTLLAGGKIAGKGVEGSNDKAVLITDAP
jgi:hypothetical protein